MNVIIVGAGLSGLAAALRFAQLGHKVTVFERREKLSTTGGIIMIRSNASKIAKGWNLGPDLDAISDVSLSSIYRRAEDGEMLHERTPAKYSDHPDWGTFRDKLLEVLYKRAVAAHVDVKLGVSVSKVWEDESRAFVQLESRQTVQADLVLATDGGSSRLRTMILSTGVPSQLIVAPMTFQQVTVSKNELLEHACTEHLIENANLTVWFGQGSFAIGRYSTKLARFGGIFAVPVADDENPRLWQESGDISHVREVFSDYEEPIRQILHTAQSCDRWRLTEMPDLPTWSSSQGRLLLLGDSAHAMLPDAAQGFSSTVEDIEVLALLLEKYTDLTAVTKAWESIRIPRVNRIKEFARTNNQTYQLGGTQIVQLTANKKDEDMQDAEDQQCQPGMVRPDQDAEFNSPAFNAWVYAYDAATEIAKVTAVLSK